MAAGTQFTFKVVLLGEGAVGKTSLVLRYVEDKFNDKHLSTLQASFFTKMLHINNKKVKIAVWDTAGQERFHALGPIYYRDSNGAILVYDITDEDSFHRVKNWVKELRTMLGSDLPLVIAGNKIDLEKNRHVAKDEALSYAESVGAKHFDTSAKQNIGVQEMFMDLATEMLSKHLSNNSGGSTRNNQKNKGLSIVDDSQSENMDRHRKSGCCS